MKICVRANDNDNSCIPKTNADGIPVPYTEPPEGMNGTFDGRPDSIPGEPGSLLPGGVDQETFAPIQKDNDSVGDGESQSCEERLQNFLASLSIGGIVAIAISMIAVGVLLTLVVVFLKLCCFNLPGIFICFEGLCASRPTPASRAGTASLVRTPVSGL